MLSENDTLLLLYMAGKKKGVWGALCFKDGGEGGIRTLDTLLTYTPLAGERLQPLGHFSKFLFIASLSYALHALPGRALLGASHLALRVAVVPPALPRSPRLLGQPLGHFSRFPIFYSSLASSPAASSMRLRISSRCTATSLGAFTPIRT